MNHIVYLQPVRKIFIVFLMAPLLVGVVITGTSSPVLLMIISLFIIALAEPSTRTE